MKNPTSNPPSRERRANDRALATKYGVTDRTVRNWQTAGAPLDNAEAMPRWIMDHQAHGVERNPSLPPGLEHSNALRLMVETAAAHFLLEASSSVLEMIIETLLEDGELTPKRARGVAMLVWYGLLHQLKRWTMNDRFNQQLMVEGMSLDSLMKDLVPTWREKSAPPKRFAKQPVPECIQKALKASGGTTFKYANLDEEGSIIGSNTP